MSSDGEEVSSAGEEVSSAGEEVSSTGELFFPRCCCSEDAQEEEGGLGMGEGRLSVYVGSKDKTSKSRDKGMGG